MSDIQKELDDAKNSIKGLVAQLEASKQMCNEYIQQNFQMRTNLVMFQNNAQESAQQIGELKSKVLELGARIVELTPKVEVDAA